MDACDPLRDSPRKTEAVVGRSTSTKLVDNYKGVLRRRLDGADGISSVVHHSALGNKIRTRRIVAVSNISAMNVDTPLS